MFRNTLFAALAALGLTSWGAAESFAQESPQAFLKPQAVVVTRIFPGGSAARQGIEVGDVIVSVNGHAVRSSEDLRFRLGQAGRVAELGLIDVRTGWQNSVTVYPTHGRIGVDVRPTSPESDFPTRPVRPILPPWNPGVRPTPPTPVNPPGWGVRPLPVPGSPPSILPVR